MSEPSNPASRGVSGAPPALPRAPHHSDAPRTYQRMLSGRFLHLYDPNPLDLEIEDLLVGISRVNRWNGQTRGPVGFNVAHHSVLVDDILRTMVWPKAPREARLWALSHDLAEGAYGDLVSVVKAVVGPVYTELEGRLETCIRLKIGLPATMPEAWTKAVKKADRIAAVTEAVRLCKWTETDARRDVGAGYRGRLWPHPIDPWPENEARSRWRDRFHRLGGAG